MASLYRHATLLTNINHNLFICILLSLALPAAREGAARTYDDRPNIDEGGRRLTREYHLRQGALRGLIVKPSRQYNLQHVEMFLGIPYAAPPTGNLRFMPPVSAVPWPGVKMATRLPPVCPQMLPVLKKGNPPSLGRQHYMNRLKAFLKNESEDCLYLNIYVPYRDRVRIVRGCLTRQLARAIDTCVRDEPALAQPRSEPCVVVILFCLKGARYFCRAPCGHALRPTSDAVQANGLNIIMEKFLSDEQIANMLDHWDSEDDLDLAALTNFENEYEDSVSEHSSHRSDSEMELDSHV
ncbi:Neuroligin-1 [Eumeta japonica]|uniref:Neuroligin-1 n=1 Tax=Eumeta variegata TaxID=151549 RepID=A0A4C1Y9N9_EUMVA|nr:Neuroligin-1 [Eumeta japonica]